MAPPQGIPKHLLTALESLTITSDVSDYWSKFPDFEYDEDQSWQHEFARLAKFRTWKTGSNRYVKELRQCYAKAMAPANDNSSCDSSVVSTDSGSVHMPIVSPHLENWQTLCREFDLEPGPSVKICKGRLSRVNVNIKDLLLARRNGNKPRTFLTPWSLAEYTRANHQYFSKEKAKKNRFLRVFLKNLF